MSIWLLGQPEELRKKRREIFLSPIPLMLHDQCGSAGSQFLLVTLGIRLVHVAPGFNDDQFWKKGTTVHNV